MDDDKKTLGFPLFVDEDTADLFVLFVNLYQDFEDDQINKGELEMGPLAIKARKTFAEFRKYVGDQIHKHKWCKDPDCHYNEDGDE